MEIIFGLVSIGLIIWFIKALLGMKTVPAPSYETAQPRPQKADPKRVSKTSVVVDSASGLAVSFTITSSFSGVDTSAKVRQDVTSDSCWVPPGRAVTVAGRKIPGGMLYVGDGLGSVSGYRLEPALIDPSLPVAKSVPAGFRRAMGYWPSYDSISPEDRVVLLAWLASGRRDPQSDIGYVFLFFYGLERRALADAKCSDAAKAELPAIRQEVAELLAVYGSNHSFNRYATQLIEVLDATGGVAEAALPQARNGYGVPLITRVAIGRLIAANKPLPADWALAWVLSHPETSVRTPMQRCRREFEALFRARYQKEFGEGMTMKPNRSRLAVSIRPASASFGGALNTTLDLPDIDALSAPIGKLRQLGEDCASDLDAFSRWVGRNPASKATVAALALLPVELADGKGDSEARELWPWLEQALGPHDRALISADDLIKHCPSFGSGKLAKAEAVVLAQLLGKRAYGVEPDVRFGGAPIAPGSSVVLFKLAAEPMAIATPQYSAATTLLHLAVAVAAADGSISEVEEERLATHIRVGLGLNAAETARLAAHLEWLKVSVPGTTGLKKKLAALNATQKMAIADFLIGVAGADGHVSAEEVKTLGKLYPLLGLEQDAVYGHVHAMTAGDASPVTGDDPAPIVPGHRAGSFAIPQPGHPSKSVQLDMSVVQAKLADSAKLAVILQDVFSDDDDAPTRAVAPQPTASKVPQGYAALLAQLSERPQWTRSEFEEAAEALGLMPDGALDAMNEAAFEHVGGPLLEGDDPIDVDIAAAKELMA